MLYALMNLGGWFPSFAFLLRDEKFLGLGITGTFWFYVGITVLALVSTVVLLTSGTVAKAIEKAKADTAREQGEAEKAGEKPAEAGDGDERPLSAGADVGADRRPRGGAVDQGAGRAGAGRAAAEPRCWRALVRRGLGRRWRWRRRPGASWPATRSPTSSSSSSSSR